MTPPPDPVLAPGEGLEARVAAVGRDLAVGLAAVCDALPGTPEGPQRLSETLSIDKVLASRLLKALRQGDPIATVHAAPGPEPLRRFLRAARKLGVEVGTADRAVDAFEELIRRDAGDRGSLDAMLAAWLPEARLEFELRRKQAAHRAISQLRGASADTALGAVILHPNADGETLDVLWLLGTLGLRRLRPGAPVRFSTRRQVEDDHGREPLTLSGERIEGPESLRLDEFCHGTPADVEVVRSAEVVHYMLGESGFGPRSGVDLLLAELNLAEMPRFVPAVRRRKGHVFVEVTIPTRRQIFDVFVHEDVYPGSQPELLIYDTVPEGVANANDRARDVDRVETTEAVLPIVGGVAGARTEEVPRYRDVLQHVFTQLAWDPARFRGHRCRIDYPVYGWQVCLAFDPPSPP